MFTQNVKLILFIGRKMVGKGENAGYQDLKTVWEKQKMMVTMGHVFPTMFVTFPTMIFPCQEQILSIW